MLVATVRRRSCNRHPSPEPPISSRRLTRPKPEIGVFPVVVNTESEFKKRGRDHKISTTKGASGTACCVAFLARFAGIVQTCLPKSISDQDIPHAGELVAITAHV